MDALRDLLSEAIDDLHPKKAQRVEDPDPSISKRVSLAWLEGPVVRQLLASDAASDHPVIDRIWPQRFEIIIDINLDFTSTAAGDTNSALLGAEANHADPRNTAKALIKKYIEVAKSECQVDDPDQGVDDLKTDTSNQYVFARLQGDVIQKLVEVDQRIAGEMAAAAAKLEKPPAKTSGKRSGKKAAAAAEPGTPDTAPFLTIYHIWPDFRLGGCITRSIATVKVDAAQQSFTALGSGIVWAVMDSGITNPATTLRRKSAAQCAQVEEDAHGSLGCRTGHGRARRGREW